MKQKKSLVGFSNLSGSKVIRTKSYGNPRELNSFLKKSYIKKLDTAAVGKMGDPKDFPFADYLHARCTDLSTELIMYNKRVCLLSLE